ncbi:MAG: succinylglutamate desuccinylase/aspartoacylase family protein [Candidatus Omnitrophica bacterium]|nr:succinylglutamate desuccinylase/aspartoacylase family protein [Candidatus Omnitrophota bacterium]
MKKMIFLIFVSAVLVFSANPQSADDYFRVMGEIYFRFPVYPQIDLNKVSKIVSISKISNDYVYAYASEKEFNEFLKTNISFEILQHPGYLVNIDPALRFSKQLLSSYPSYPDYIEMMNNFHQQYPDICSLYEIGSTTNGRKILAVKITGLTDTFFKPKVFLTSTIHGNEPAGYMMMLYLIEDLLSGYGKNNNITEIVDRCEIWINPLANPDGTYWAGDDTVFGARRYNANNVDLNRNFPDPQEGMHPDGNEWQLETIAMMNFADLMKPCLSANFHSGTEVVNYPWDTWERLHPDNDWFVYISRKYADTVHLNSPEDYMNNFNNGITNGYSWYRITGGRQDYMNYFQYCREITIELSDDFFPSNPYVYWTYNRDALIGFIYQSLTGICGRVFCQEGEVVCAKVEIPGHDYDNSFVFSDGNSGKFFRLLLPEIYNLKFSAPYHYPLLLENVNVESGILTNVSVMLEHAEKGDPSADRVIDIEDVILCLKMAIGLVPEDLKSCDINGDTMIDITDVILILRKAIGL